MEDENTITSPSQGSVEYLMSSMQGLERKAAGLQRLIRFTCVSERMEDLLDHILETVMDIVGSNAGVLAIVEPSTKEFQFINPRWKGVPRPLSKDRRALMEKILPKMREGVIGQVLTTGEPQILSSERDPGMVKDPLADQSIQAIQNLIAVPLTMANQTIGVLELFNKDTPDGFSSEDLDLLLTLASLVAPIVKSHGLREEALLLAHEKKSVSLEWTIEKLQKKLDEAHAEKETLLKELAFKKSEFLKKEETNAASNHELIRYRVWHDEGKNRLKEISDELTTLESQLEKSRQSEADTYAENIALKQKYEGGDNRIQKLEKENNHAKDWLKKATEKMRELKQDNDNKQAQLDALSEEKDALTKKISAVPPPDPSFDQAMHTLQEKKDRQGPLFYGHALQRQETARRLGRAMGLRDGTLEATERAALIYDFPRIFLPEKWFESHRDLTEDQWKKIHDLPLLTTQLFDDISTLKETCDILRHANECWDGTGTPKGMKESHIPLGARILASIVLFESMRCDAPGRPGLPLDVALSELKGQSGSRLDPECVKILTDLLKKNNSRL